MKTDKLFCPDIGDYCIEEGCAAYIDHMVIEDINGNIFVEKVTNKEFKYDAPITFFVKTGFCSKYSKVTDKVSYELLENFKKEII